MQTDFAPVAKMLANPARSAVVNALMEGPVLTAGELARIAGVQASTISEHLNLLLDGGLVTVITTGRHRYYQLSNADVAAALEAFSLICPAMPVRSLRQSAADRAMRLARFCYDHVAGALGVALLDRMCEAGWLVSVPRADFDLTEVGAAVLARIGIDVDTCRQSRRHFARSCLDFSERRPHLAGALGASMTSTFLSRGWLCRTGSGRAVQVTEIGEHSLRSSFGIGIAELSRDQDSG